MEGTSQAVQESPDQLKVPASLSLCLKSEKTPALLYLGKVSSIVKLQYLSLGFKQGARSQKDSPHDGNNYISHGMEINRPGLECEVQFSKLSY